ncbi:MAG: YncE family protein [Propionibacteriaceae bacterium]|nr:YncE family protein [Propionibacteriaceae bacterium]
MKLRSALFVPALVAALLAGSAVAAPAEAAAPPVKVKVSSKVFKTGGTFPYDIAVGAKNGRLYVLDHDKPIVTVLNQKTGKQIAKIKLTNAKVYEINGIKALGNKVYVLDGYRHRMYVIDATKNKLVKTVILPHSETTFDDPEVMEVSPDGKRIYIGPHYGTKILSYSVKADKVTAKYDISKIFKVFPAEANVTSGQVVDIATSDSGRYLYLSMMVGMSVDIFSMLAIYDTKTKKVTAVETSKDNPWGLGNTEFFDLLNVGKDKVYRTVSTEVEDGQPFYVEVLDLSNPKKIKSIDRVPLPKGNIGYKMLYTHGYVLVNNPDQDGFTKYLPDPLTVQIIDTKKKGAKAVVGSFSSKSNEMLVGALSKDGKTVYYINGGAPDPGWKGKVTVAKLSFK